MNALEIHGLKKNYPGFALDIDELTLPEGCVLGLVGENGAGKSTTIKLILDLIRPEGGTVTILGRDSRTEFAAAREELGVVLDEVGIPGLTARQMGKVLSLSCANWDGAVYDLSLIHI